MVKKIFIDSSAFIALYLADDEFHKSAVTELNKLKNRQIVFVTSNFVLDEVYTFLRAKANKQNAIKFAEFLAENTEMLKIIRINVGDEQRAFEYFKVLDGRGISFTDCASFALMKRLKLKTVFTFDKDFSKAGFAVVP